METLINQEFLYRENPVDYDGTGTITRIKGNTVKINQLVQNGNFADTSNWTVQPQTPSTTFTVSNNVVNSPFLKALKKLKLSALVFVCSAI